MRVAAKIDANQPKIVEALRRCGWTVEVLSAVGKGVPDIMVGAISKKQGRVNILLEIKDGSRIPSEQKLTPAQEEWHSKWRGQVHVVNSPEQAIETVTALIMK